LVAEALRAYLDTTNRTPRRSSEKET
jgi:hypothetical protein